MVARISVCAAPNKSAVVGEARCSSGYFGSAVNRKSDRRSAEIVVATFTRSSAATSQSRAIDQEHVRSPLFQQGIYVPRVGTPVIAQRCCLCLSLQLRWIASIGS